MTPIAFFDFDGTITRHDTFIPFARFARGDARFIMSLLLSSPWILLWKLGFISNARAKEKLFGFLFKGISDKEFRLLAESFASKIDSDLRADTMDAVKHHLALSHHVAIVSASIDTWIEPWAKRHDISNVVATRIELDDENRLTGRFSTPNCHGAEKVRRIKAMFGSLENTETYAYGDSKGDDAMLQFVKHPYKIR